MKIRHCKLCGIIIFSDECDVCRDDQNFFDDEVKEINTEE